MDFAALTYVVADAVYKFSPISYCPFLIGVIFNTLLSTELVIFVSVNDFDAFNNESGKFSDAV